MAGYGDDNGFAAWLADNGYSLPAGAPAPAVLRQRGSAYIDGMYGARFSGTPTGGFDQERAWPRIDAYGHGLPVPDSVIPSPVVRASYAAAWQEATSSGSLSVVAVSGRQIKREKIEGAIEREFFEGEGGGIEKATPVLSEVEGLLAPFLTSAVRDAGPAVFVV